MKQEDKELLLKDLCARLPYGVMCYGVTKDTDEDGNYIDKGVTDILYELHSYKCCYGLVGLMNECDIKSIKPYLRPMSSMTEEECIALSKLIPYETDAWKYIKTPIPLYIANIEQFDFFHRHHLDWRGLISKGLAIEVTEENNPYKE